MLLLNLRSPEPAVFVQKKSVGKKNPLYRATNALPCIFQFAVIGQSQPRKTRFNLLSRLCCDSFLFFFPI